MPDHPPDPVNKVVGHFQLGAQIGVGGMGVVYLARDLALDRDVAIKTLNERHGADPAASQRFLIEAKITGQLAHPGIPAVHELGTLPDGRPFLAMKLVKGQTLRTLLQQRSEPGEQRGRFIAIFEQICQALGYAHDHRVIHRDLKPSNVMVGTHGEVQVMDWGLAKLLPRPTPTEPPAVETTMSVLFTARSADSTEEEHSPTGVVGTPAYMAPEQARGTGEDVDERADVFGLGGILCAILTGQPPFIGRGREEVMCKAAAGELADAFARLETSGADGELVQLCKACLTAVKQDRPADAGVVAARVTAYLAGVQQRLHAAEVERAAAQARAEEAAKKMAAERRARRIVLGLSLAVLVVLAGGIVGTTLGLKRAQRALGAEFEQRQRAEAREREAEQQKERAQNAEKETLEDYRASMDDAIEQLIGADPMLGPQEKAYLDKTLKRWQVFSSRTGDDERSRAIRAEGEFRVAFVRAKLGQTAEALAGYREALAQRERLAGDFPTVTTYRRQLALNHNNLGVLLAGQNQADKAAEHYRQALDIYQKLADDFPTVPADRQQLAWSHNNLGNLLKAQNQREKAAEHYHEALAIQQKLADDFPTVPAYRQDLAKHYYNLGALLADQNQVDAAAQHYSKALAIQQKLADEYPTVPSYRQELARTHNNLALLLAGQKQADKAAEQHRQALAIRQKLADDFPAVPSYRQELASSHNNLGLLLRGQNQPAKAAEHYRKALGIFHKLADDLPAVPTYRRDLATSHNNLGLLLAGQKQADKAAEQYQKALVIQQKLADDFPAVPTYRGELAWSHNNLGILLAGQKQADKAAEQFRKALAIRQKLADDFPAVPAYRKDLAQSHHSLGLALAGQNQADKAAEQCRKALDIQQKLASEYPTLPVYQVELAGGCCNFGHLLRDGGKPADSLSYFDRAVAVLSKVHRQDPRSVAPRLYLRNSHYGRARTYDLLGNHAEAVMDWTRAIELSAPRERRAYQVRRASSRVRAGQVAEAIAEVVEWRKAGTVTADQWYDFACIHAVASAKSADKKQEYADESMRMLRRAVQAGYKNAAHMAKDKDLDVLRDRDEFQKLMQSLAKPKEKQPAGGR